jgi:hypothetical protein
MKKHKVLVVQWFFLTSLLLFILLQLGILNRAPQGLTLIEKIAAIFEALVYIHLVYFLIAALIYSPGIIARRLRLY